MAIHLDVPIIGQQSQMSCWWACMRMVLSYFGRPAPLTPTSVDLRFQFSPFSPPTNALTQHSDPSHWYYGGIPPQYLGAAAEMTGFRLADRLAEWTPRNTEAALRRYGPMIFYGFWSGFPHAIVLKGALDGNIVLNDPGQNPYGDRGETGYSDMRPYDWLNERMSRVTAQAGGAEIVSFAPPMYYPDPRPVRATQRSAA